MADDASEANASAESPISTDRPTASYSPALVPRRALQFEAGYTFSHLEANGEEVDSQRAPELLVRYGVGERVEVRLVLAGWTLEASDSGDEDGLNDVSLGAKFALAQERGGRPQLGLLVGVSLPVGHSDFTSDHVIPEVLLLATHTLSPRVGLTYNLGPSLVTSTDDRGTQTDVDLNYAVALSVATSGSVSLFAELYGAFILEGDRLDRHNFQTGTTVLLSTNFQIDLRVGFGLVESEPDWLAGAGLAFRLPF